MKSKLVAQLLWLILLAALAPGCAKKTRPDADQSALTGDTPIFPDSSRDSRDSDSGKAMGLETIHFPFDSATIEDSEKEVARQDARILKENLGLRVQIEGHCDQRGGTQYNLALGERRARALRKYLGSLGVPASRVTVISLGKERPIDRAENEAAYARNRRANFVLTTAP